MEDEVSNEDAIAPIGVVVADETVARDEVGDKEHLLNEGEPIKMVDQDTNKDG